MGRLAVPVSFKHDQLLCRAVFTTVTNLLSACAPKLLIEIFSSSSSHSQTASRLGLGSQSSFDLRSPLRFEAEYANTNLYNAE